MGPRWKFGQCCLQSHHACADRLFRRSIALSPWTFISVIHPGSPPLCQKSTLLHFWEADKFSRKLETGAGGGQRNKTTIFMMCAGACCSQGCLCWKLSPRNLRILEWSYISVPQNPCTWSHPRLCKCKLLNWKWRVDSSSDNPPKESRTTLNWWRRLWLGDWPNQNQLWLFIFIDPFLELGSLHNLHNEAQHCSLDFFFLAHSLNNPGRDFYSFIVFLTKKNIELQAD